MKTLHKGQRWISETEPELGVGVVVDSAPGRVFLLFRASSTLRQYAMGSAPIKRVEFGVGDTIKVHDGSSMVIESVETRAGLLVYHGAGREVPETDLSDTLSFCKPEERLYAGQVDNPVVFDLRLEALRRRHQIRHAPARGLIGARIELIPHQLAIAQDVAGRVLPRVLLADEVGLGKTIEACLILHRLHRSGRAARILILVPEPLVHQWFVELLRRFHLRVSIFDEERCRAIEAGDPGANPFLDDQVILCPLQLLAENPARAVQAVTAGWDLLVVDEAHHLAWTPGAASPEYTVAAQLAARTPGVILLTATPEQLGAEGHFARLRLLDPDRYGDFSAFEKGRATYRETARITAKVLDGKKLTAADTQKLRRLFPDDAERLEHTLAAMKTGAPDARETLVADLLDRHGPGRVMFRNTRAAIKGFPKRKALLIPLDGEPRLAAERLSDRSDEARSYPLTGDPRVEWLVGFLQKRRSAKVLLICRTREKVLALEAALRDRVKMKVALFHEDLTLLQRDRNAAWFSEPDGAQILLCSEIGSEGRNFQFAHHLVLFDLPEHTELLEQRIGRLDRIGQTETISLHVPLPRGSHLEILGRWYHEGLDAFETPLEGGREILARFGPRLDALLEGKSNDLDALIAETRTTHTALARELAEGQDRLLQMNSFRPERARALVEDIARHDRDTTLDDFVLRMFDHFGVHVEELSARTYLAVPAELTTDAFPELPPEGLTVTADRARALAREEIDFLTWDHPLVTSAIDLLVGSEQGNSSFALWPGGTEQTIYLEAVYVLEPVAPPALNADRFLPPTPLRIVVDPKGDDVSADVQPATLRQAPAFQLLDNARIKHKLLPAMLEKSREHATRRAESITQAATARASALLGGEAARLRALRAINDHVREEEITLLESHAAELAARLAEAPLRLDAIRLIWRNGAE